MDEDSKFVRSKSFAKLLNGSDNYFLLITRNYLADLPISVDEIYELTGAKNKKFKSLYEEKYKMYDRPSESTLPYKPEIIITEDSKSGYQFFKTIVNKCGIECISAEGKSKIITKLKEYSDKKVVVIADGAAFGPEMDEVVKQQDLNPKNMAIFLPESFEWLILKSGVVKLDDTEKVDKPELFVDSTEFISWERYFTTLLESITREIEYQHYKKNKLPEYYLQEKNVEKIKAIIRGIDFE